MAAQQQLSGAALERAERRLRLKISMVLGYDKLQPLEQDWSLTFFKERSLVLPIFGCRGCGYSYLLQLRLEGALWYGEIECPSLEPLYQHQQLCKAFQLDIVRNAEVDSRSLSLQRRVPGGLPRDRMDSVTRRTRSYETECVKESVQLCPPPCGAADNVEDVQDAVNAFIADAAETMSLDELSLPVNFDFMQAMEVLPFSNETSEEASASLKSALSEAEHMVLAEEDSECDRPSSSLMEKRMNGVPAFSVPGNDHDYVLPLAAAAVVPDDGDLHEQMESERVVRQKTVLSRQERKDADYAALLEALPAMANKMSGTMLQLESDTESVESADASEAWNEHGEKSNESMETQKKVLFDDNKPSDSSEEGWLEEPMARRQAVPSLQKMLRKFGLVQVKKRTANQRRLSKHGGDKSGTSGKTSKIPMKVMRRKVEEPEKEK